MKPPDWKTTEEALRQMHPVERPREPEAFWRTFKARAASLPREADPAAIAAMPMPMGRRFAWAAGMAAACLVAVGVLWVTLYGPSRPTAVAKGRPNDIQAVRVDPSNDAPRTWRDAQTQSTFVWIDLHQPNEIRNLRVNARHRGTIIWQDEPSESTFLWIDLTEPTTVN